MSITCRALGVLNSREPHSDVFPSTSPCKVFVKESLGINDLLHFGGGFHLTDTVVQSVLKTFYHITFLFLQINEVVVQNL